jgi:hypothetical protein
MTNLMMALISYTFAAMAGICFVGGVSLLSDRKGR